MQKEKEIKAGVIALNVVSDDKFLEINGVKIERKEYNNEYVLTSWDVSKIHKREVREVNQNLKNSRSKMIENEDYYIVPKAKLAESKILIQDYIPNNVKEIILFTESGYLMLTKSFNDDFSWQIQRELIKNYFKLKKIRNALENGEIEIVPKTPEKHPVSEYDLKQQEINLINAENSRESIKLSKGQLLKSIADEISNEKMKNTLLIHSANTVAGKEILLPEAVEKPSFDTVKIAEKLKEKYGILISANMLG